MYLNFNKKGTEVFADIYIVNGLVTMVFESKTANK
jgi:hypothetical protein